MPQNVINLIIGLLADGWEATGGVIARKLKITGADVTIIGSGSATQTFPATSSTLLSNQAAEISGFTGKATPVDADVTLIEDSAASNAKKKLTWANIKATLKTYFDTLYIASTLTISNYSPTPVGVTNVAATSIPGPCYYLRLGAFVIVIGALVIDPTATGATEVGLPLPVASAFTGYWQCGGLFNNYNAVGNSGNVQADAANDRARFLINVQDTASRGYPFIFAYPIL